MHSEEIAKVRAWFDNKQKWDKGKSEWGSNLLSNSIKMFEILEQKKTDKDKDLLKTAKKLLKELTTI